VSNTEGQTEAKRQELRAAVSASLEEVAGDDAARLASAVIDYFASITAPEWEARMDLVVLRSGGLGGGSSTKPGNVVLNLRKLVVAIASGAITLAGATVPWALILGALVVWDNLWSSLQLKIDDDQACVLWTLWNGRDEDRTFPKPDVHEAVNRERSLFGRQPLGAGEIDHALGDLVRMRCIEDAADPERWWLREWVSIDYS
jgi:hypothetical protein